MKRDDSLQHAPFERRVGRSGVALIDESDYAQVMDSQVLPFLRRFKRDDWYPVERTSATLKGLEPHPKDKQGIHSVYLDQARFREEVEREAATSANPEQRIAPIVTEKFHGTVVISHGFTESAIKYVEMAWYLLQSGFNVLIIEHRGHGRSLRETEDPMVVTMSDWRLYVSDFVGAISHARTRFGIGEPLHLFAHSLGGAIGAAVLEQYPDLFDRAVLSSPMLEPKTGMPVWLAYALSAGANKLGEGNVKVPIMPVFSEELKNNKSGGRSQARMSWYHQQRVLDWEYRATAPSFDWVLAALKLDRTVMDPAEIEKIKASVLIFQSGKDHWVHPRAQTKFLTQTQEAGVEVRGIRVPGAGHELFSEPNDVFAPYLHEVLTFLAGEGGE
ncbi:MAG: alpha/beta hydrolase [Bifidobacteriaceae bacterium]|jgi:lysophospholipase|nr:alpha/beta hydrolase [Bifidobacteriaceae bacterium]MCI1978635.1 alpha/beta hydrolase [Bifidobacteriaceae bacterium]